MIVDRVCRSLAIGHTFSGRDSTGVMQLQNGVREICQHHDEVVRGLAGAVLQQAEDKVSEFAASMLARISASREATQKQFVLYFSDALAIEVDGALTAPAVTALLGVPLIADQIHPLMARCFGLNGIE
mmetsp:Transcript_1885/g.2827  ORF Transcript_1885/g.2827 Transcript_1885/m.2827 type:complete len:128 (-) Transcript_1885:33-416(-)